MKFELFSKKEYPDPSKSSIREENIKLKKNKVLNIFPKKEEVFIDVNTKERFFEIKNNRNGHIQKMTSLLLKGIINSTDIVEHNDKYYSHAQKIKHLNATKEYEYNPEIIADMIILDKVFGDYDKKIHQSKPLGHPLIKDGWEGHQNIMVNDSEEKKYYFDFEYALQNIIPFKNKTEEDFFKKSIFEIADNLIEDSKCTTFLIIKEKTERFLQERFTDKEFFLSVIKKSKCESKFNIENLFNALKRRLEIVSEVSGDILKKVELNTKISI
jgi:hypothetical protein